MWMWIGIVVALLIGNSCSSTGSAPTSLLPATLVSPDHGVVCNRSRATCYDRLGPSIGLTELFMGHIAAERLTAMLHVQPEGHRFAGIFSPSDGVECVRKSGPCSVDKNPNKRLTAVLYGSRQKPTKLSAEARAMQWGEWQWVATRHNDNDESRPADPGRYALSFHGDGSVRVQADCNGAGGQYRLDGTGISIKITHSTMAACELGSLEQVFLRDLAAAAIYFIKAGRLYLDLKYDGGTMELARRP